MSRNSVFFAILLVALLLSAVLLRHQSATPHPSSAATTSAAVPDTPDMQVRPNTSVPAASNANTNAILIPDNLTPEATHEEYVERRIAEFQDLLANRDNDSLAVLLSELNNRDRAIRAAALEAVIQFDRPEAIPSLSDAALQTDDPLEKAELLKAIEFLQLPTASEVVAQKKARGESVPSRFIGQPPPLRMNRAAQSTQAPPSR